MSAGFFELLINLYLSIRNLNEMRVCTLNMENFGEKPSLISQKIDSFSTAIKKADCDIVGLQEISNVKQKITNLNSLILKLSDYRFSVQEATSIQLLGFIYKNKFKPNFSNMPLELPKLHYLEQQSDLKRLPYKLELKIRNNNFTVINVHWKSRAGRDSSGYKNELMRLREGVALRSELPGKNYIILGDFNANPDSVSIQSLFLNLKLNQFRFREDSVMLDYAIRLDPLYYQPSLYFKQKYGYSDYFILSDDLNGSKIRSFKIDSDHKMLKLKVSRR